MLRISLSSDFKHWFPTIEGLCVDKQGVFKGVLKMESIKQTNKRKNEKRIPRKDTKIGKNENAIPKRKEHRTSIHTSIHRG